MPSRKTSSLALNCGERVPLNATFLLCTLGRGVSVSAGGKVARPEIWPPSWCLHSPDRGEDEEGAKERQRERERQNYLQLRRCNSKSSETEGLRARRQHIMANIWASLLGLFVWEDEWGGDEGDLHNRFKARQNIYEGWMFWKMASAEGMRNSEPFVCTCS